MCYLPPAQDGGHGPRISHLKTPISHSVLYPNSVVHIINTIVKPILLYGCEVFCFANVSSLESFYLSLLNKILVVRKSTPSYMVYGEVGCRPLRVEVRERACSFWLRIQENSSPTLANKLRKTLNKMNGTLNYVSPYATYISTNVNELGLSYMYATPRILDISRDISLIKSRSRDQYVQEWTENKNNSRKVLFYNMFESKFELEHYLDALPYKKTFFSYSLHVEQSPPSY